MEKIEYFVELKDRWLWWIFFGGEWMDVGGVWREGKRRGCCGGWNIVLERGRDGVLVVVLDDGVWSRDDFWLLVLLLLLLLRIVRIIILLIIRVHDISYKVRSWGR